MTPTQTQRLSFLKTFAYQRNDYHYYYYYWTCLIIFVILVIFLFTVYFGGDGRVRDDNQSRRRNSIGFTDYNKTNVYCIMVTNRVAFARVAIENFKRQSYPDKKLIIVNTSDQALQTTDANHLMKVDRSILEIQTVRHKHTTLGSLRNMALSLVPFMSIWTTWDDDDWRSDDYLSSLYYALTRDRAKRYLVYMNRLEWNTNTDLVYRVSMENGTFVYFVYKDDVMPDFDNSDTREDESIMRYIRYNTDADKRTTILDNDPTLYVRLVHGRNTSEFVDPDKRQIDTQSHGGYVESEATREDLKYVDGVKKYYKSVK